MEENYFFIELSNLPTGDAIFGFHIYIYEPHAKSYKVDLPSNSPFDDDVKARYQILLAKGAKLAISYKQKRTFLSSLNLKDEDIAELKAFSSSVQELKRANSHEELKSKAFTIGDELKEAILTNNFQKVIEQARLEILCLPSNFNQNLSNAIYLADMQLNSDCLSSRVVSLCYFMAKSMKYDSLEDLGDLLLAAFLYDIGITQVSLSYQIMPQMNLNQTAKEDYHNHPGLAMHLIRKSKINMSLRSKKMIQDHHERHSGSGYPNGKKESHLDRIGQILALVDFAVQYSEGHISGEKSKLDEVVSNIKNKVVAPGMEFDFNPDMIAAFFALCFRSATEKAA
ncbi:MAG: HD-GYP domain-containing protein [Bacteriovoracaceae bacterium]